ncbi:hypothetical protein EYW49_00670 [Siculibacillus lacustris]|uniref:Uncharacterized protein n=1 Tax=Siculibacillus lacustris TaxID=1549641 RepID=A0A4Q9VYM7_9HYPH|nr:hypothetical protein EYW49_00670 [Siculibacillus lacustris]
MAEAIGVSRVSIQRLWEAHRLQPHRRRMFERSNDPAFAAEVDDSVGLDMEPPAPAVVVVIDEKSRIRALDRTLPGLPLKPGKGGAPTHDDQCNGTTALFAAPDVLHGTIVGRGMPKHRHQVPIAFLDAVERALPAGKGIRRRGCRRGSRRLLFSASTPSEPDRSTR